MFTEILGHPIVFYGIVFLVTILSSAMGVSIGTLLIPLAALQFGAKEAVGLLAIFWMYQNINKMVLFRGHIQWQLGWRVIAWSLPGVLLGSIALTIMPAEIFKKVLAIGMLCYLANDLLNIIPKNDGKRTLPILSMLYGFLSGFLGSGNIVKGPMFAGWGLRKESYVATYAFTSIFMNVPKIIILSVAGIIGIQMWIISIPLFAISLIGTYIGRHLMQSISETVFYWIIMASFFLAAVALLLE